jgi:hypothetical protein
VSPGVLHLFLNQSNSLREKPAVASEKPALAMAVLAHGHLVCPSADTISLSILPHCCAEITQSNMAERISGVASGSEKASYASTSALLAVLA